MNRIFFSLTQIERVLEVNDSSGSLTDIVEAARDNLVIGKA